ncbi:hypothetical protein C1701_07370 [Actinoalloteichus sp. AHMU CJ021]|uniref:hypothetical protein n=1 Tax=Actinoalloteichus sp. AHMU CJ021 TaxID=2072503 RepID=UPI000CA08C4F|nr:hypothetical protein C1701_07370 [Actinoalloteichus sp. AHMU CJ021]
MSSDHERLIREALLRQADAGPEPAEVLAGLERAGERRRRRRRGTLLVAAATVTTIAVPVAVLALADGERGPGVVAAPDTPPSEEPPDTEFLGETASLGYGPTWVPEGFLEYRRTFESTPPPEPVEGEGPTEWSHTRSWTSGPVEEAAVTAPTVTVWVLKYENPQTNHNLDDLPEVQLDDTTTAHVNEDQRGYRSRLSWFPAPDVLVVVTASSIEDSFRVATDVARSVRADVHVEFPMPLELDGPNPARSVSLGAQPGDERAWSALLSTGVPGEEDYQAELEVEYLPDRPEVDQPWMPDGAPPPVETPVLGGTAFFYAPHHPWSSGGRPASLVVPTADGRWLVVRDGRPTEGSSVTMDDLVDVADSLVVHPDVDRSWVGTRP